MCPPFSHPFLPAVKEHITTRWSPHMDSNRAMRSNMAGPGSGAITPTGSPNHLPDLQYSTRDAVPMCPPFSHPFLPAVKEHITTRWSPHMDSNRAMRSNTAGPGSGAITLSGSPKSPTLPPLPYLWAAERMVHFTLRGRFWATGIKDVLSFPPYFSPSCY